VDVDEEEENHGKKKKEDETILGTIKSLVAEIREDRKKAEKRAEKMEDNINVLKEADIENKQNFAKIEASRESDNVYSATVREDLDVIDNETLKNTVIVKKLRSSGR